MYGLPTRGHDGHVPVPSYCTSHLLVTLSPRLPCDLHLHPTTYTALRVAWRIEEVPPHTRHAACRHLGGHCPCCGCSSRSTSPPEDPCSKSLGPAHSHHLPCHCTLGMSRETGAGSHAALLGVARGPSLILYVFLILSSDKRALLT